MGDWPSALQAMDELITAAMPLCEAHADQQMMAYRDVLHFLIEATKKTDQEHRIEDGVTLAALYGLHQSLIALQRE